MISAVTAGDSVVLADGQVQTPVKFTRDDSSVFIDHLSHEGTPESLALRVKQRIALDERQVAVKALPLIPAQTVVDLSEDVLTTTPMTTAQIATQQARSDFFTADRLVTVLLADQAKGYPIDAAALNAAQKQAAQLYDPAYRTTAV